MKYSIFSIISFLAVQFICAQSVDSLGIQQLTVVKSFDPATAAAQKLKDQPLWDSLPKARSGGKYTYPSFGLGPVWGSKQAHQLPPLTRKAHDVYRYFASLEGGNLKGYGAEFGLNTSLSRRTDFGIITGISGAESDFTDFFQDPFYRNARLVAQAQSSLNGALLSQGLTVSSHAFSYYGYQKQHELMQTSYQMVWPIDLATRFQTLNVHQRVQFDQGTLQELAWEGSRVGNLLGFRETKFMAMGRGSSSLLAGDLEISGRAQAMWVHRSENALDQFDPQGSGYRLGLVDWSTAYVFQAEEIDYRLGVKGAYHAQAGSDRVYVFPNLVAAYQAPSGEFQGEFSLSGGMESPDFNSLRQINPWLSANQLIRPSRTTYSVQASGVWSPNGSLQLQATLYTDQVNDRALFALNPLNYFRSTPDALGNSYQVVYDQVTTSGLDLSAYWSPISAWNIRLDGGWRHMVTDRWTKAWNIPTAYFNTQLEGRFLKRWFWGAQGQWMNNRYDQFTQLVQFIQPGSYPSSLIELPGRFIAHTQFRYSFRDQWNFSLKINNLFQQSQTPWAQYPEMGRMVLLGVNYQWDRFKF